MSPTRDTGLFIMSESLLKNALGANHQDINGKRSNPPPFNYYGAGAGISSGLFRGLPAEKTQQKQPNLDNFLT